MKGRISPEERAYYARLSDVADCILNARDREIWRRFYVQEETIYCISVAMHLARQTIDRALATSRVRVDASAANAEDGLLRVGVTVKDGSETRYEEDVTASEVIERIGRRQFLDQMQEESGYETA